MSEYLDLVDTFPDTHDLQEGLEHIFRAQDPSGGGIHILHREAHLHRRSFPAEVVAYRRGDGSEGEVFCKYMYFLQDRYKGQGSCSGVVREAQVYEHVLPALPLSLPMFHGAYRHAATGSVWLILQRLVNTVDLDLSTDERDMPRAAAWIGRFHALREQRRPDPALAFLPPYDAAYYRGWARRTCELAGTWHRRFSWLKELCDRFEEVIPLLLGADPTVIHGEYYPSNILVVEGTIYPHDWESAAVAAGEIDLAALSEGWDADVRGECERAYCRARWPEGAPADFARRVAAARLCLHFCWLGDQRDWSAVGEAVWRLEELETLGKQLGLIAGRVSGD